MFGSDNEEKINELQTKVEQLEKDTAKIEQLEKDIARLYAVIEKVTAMVKP